MPSSHAYSNTQCTDWKLECFYVQCPAGSIANGRGTAGKCFRESPHVIDNRIFNDRSYGDFMPRSILSN